MKFQDIPRFPHAEYKVDVPWTHLEQNLELLGAGAGLNLDPDFQREHVWTKEQQSAYVEFQLMGGEVSRTIVFNAPNWGRVNGEEGVVELLDGKQRLEAVRAFLRNEVPAFGLLFKEFEGTFPSMEHRFQFQVCSLTTREEVLSLYLKINAGGTPHSAEELARVRKLLEKERKQGAKKTKKAKS